MDCGYAANCPAPPPPNGGIGTAVHIGGMTLPMTGAELAWFVGLALIIMCAGVCLRVYAEKRR